MIEHREITLERRARGCHLVTSEVLDKLGPLPDKALLTLTLLHTSAALTLNENCDRDVRLDLADILDRLVPERQAYFRHTFEGPDDMPAHALSSIIGVTVTVPVDRGMPRLGTWQGIYLCEFRRHATPRRVLATIVS